MNISPLPSRRPTTAAPRPAGAGTPPRTAGPSRPAPSAGRTVANKQLGSLLGGLVHPGQKAGQTNPAQQSNLALTQSVHKAGDGCNTFFGRIKNFFRKLFTGQDHCAAPKVDPAKAGAITTLVRNPSGANTNGLQDDLNQLPKPVLDRLNQQGVKIVVGSPSPDANRPAQGSSWDPATKTITIPSSATDNRQLAKTGIYNKAIAAAIDDSYRNDPAFAATYKSKTEALYNQSVTRWNWESTRPPDRVGPEPPGDDFFTTNAPPSAAAWTQSALAAYLSDGKVLFGGPNDPAAVPKGSLQAGSPLITAYFDATLGPNAGGP